MHSGFILIACLCYVLKSQAAFKESYVTFGNGVTSERYLPVCSNPHQSCNIIYRRFWLSPKVVRLCKCADRSECPFNWISEDKHTVNITGRIQIKFCSPVGDLPPCGANEFGLATRTIKNLKTNVAKRLAYVGCYCNMRNNYFKIMKTEMGESPGFSIREQFYSCYELPQCQDKGFCGYITNKRYETYMNCKCRPYQVCIWKDRKTIRITLPLYEGAVYKGYCQPYE